MLGLLVVRTVRITFLQTQGFLVSVYILGLILRFVRSRIRRQRLAGMATKVWLSDTFALWNLQTTVLCCAFVYDPVGTFRPEWADSLG